jgi:RIO kinase 1
VQHTDVFYTDKYEIYEEQFDPLLANDPARRKRKPKSRVVHQSVQQERITGLVDALSGVETGFRTTYQPSRHEEGWLLDSIRNFYEEVLISDVLAQIKGGKEASVYRCAADPSTGVDFLAAKVYRPRQFRNLRNDALYRSGRPILTEGGRAVKATDNRIMRAVGKKSRFGVQVSHTSWLMHEFVAMQRLYEAGGAVPQPLAASDNAILMHYVGDAQLAAPTLNNIRLERDEAADLFDEVMRNIQLMLAHDIIHGDLSAYNILYWSDGITLIDFPQVVNVYGNDQAYNILQRDVQRVCEYFARQGVVSDSVSLTQEMWQDCVES